MKFGRRQFLQAAVGGVGGAFLAPTPSATSNNLPQLRPEDSGIEHIVVVMMENRSFDHLLGWLPNADAKQDGLTFLDRSGVAHPTGPLAPDFTGCGHPDPDHSYTGGREQFNGGAMDGFLRSGANDSFAIGYYIEQDRPFFNALARNYTTLDRWFSSILAPTIPNRLFAHAAQTDRLTNSLIPTRMRTIWDQLSAAGVKGRYYFLNLPILGLWLTRYISITRPYLQFLLDAASGDLPAVSFVDPWFNINDDGLATDDEPHADIRRGDAFLADAFHAVALGPAWGHTVFIVIYDEWGGFFDHVPPPRIIAPNAVDTDLVGGRALLGFRVPAVVASPFSRGAFTNPRVNSLLFDHTSILKLIEWRWNLPPLTARDASNDINNLVLALDLEQPDSVVPHLPRPPLAPAQQCV
jgi:phospholipase C